jgi:hypothetical protein
MRDSIFSRRLYFGVSHIQLHIFSGRRRRQQEGKIRKDSSVVGSCVAGIQEKEKSVSFIRIRDRGTTLSEFVHKELIIVIKWL